MREPGVPSEGAADRGSVGFRIFDRQWRLQHMQLGRRFLCEPVGPAVQAKPAQFLVPSTAPEIVFCRSAFSEGSVHKRVLPWNDVGSLEPKQKLNFGARALS